VCYLGRFASASLWFKKGNGMTTSSGSRVARPALPAVFAFRRLHTLRSSFLSSFSSSSFGSFLGSSFGSSFDRSARPGRQRIAAGGFALLLVLALCAPARAQNVVFEGFPTGVPASGLNDPLGVAVDGSGNVFIADTDNNRVVEVTPGGIQTTVPTSTLNHPSAVAADAAGDVFITDSGNNQVLKVTPGGVQTTVPATGLNRPEGVAVDGLGDVFISDDGNNQVVEVTPSGVQTTVLCCLNNPKGVAVDGSGDVFIANFGDSTVLEVFPGGSYSAVPFRGIVGPLGVAVDAAGDVLQAAKCSRLRRVASKLRSPPECRTRTPWHWTLRATYSSQLATPVGRWC